ncbi:MAG: DNA methyltransferase [Candidatus Hatepunaea meridiana]|nr:DNA methyltransferase [Candidatus Hatepunaea meridiana]
MDYLNINPVSKPIPPKRQEAKRHYGVHPYFTRRSYNVVQEYIKTFTQPGDLVVDPFGGSGVAAIEALVLKRRAVHVDINPLANFITQCIAVSPVDLEAIDNEFIRIESIIKPYCKELTKLSDSEIAGLSIDDWYPEDVPLPINADFKYVHDLFAPRQLLVLARLRTVILETQDDLIRDLLLFVFSATVQKCNLTVTRTENNGVPKGGPISAVLKVARYWRPPNPVELEPYNEFCSKYKKFIEAKKETNDVIGDFYSSENLRIIKGDATDLRLLIPTESADYIYTDPPYGANFAYLDLSTMWNAWLDLPVTDDDRQAEIIEGGNLSKTKEDYSERLQQSIYEIFRILKYDRWFSLVFYHKDTRYWTTIVKAAEACGFEYVNTAVVKAGIISYHKHKNPLKVLSGELVINFIKKRRPKTLAVSSVGVKAVDFIMNSAELSIVQGENGASTEDIYNDLIPKLIETGLLAELKDNIADITPLLGDKFDFNPLFNRWVIPPNTKLGSYIPLHDRIRIYTESYLNYCKRRDIRPTFDMIWAHVMPELKNGKQPVDQTFTAELEKIAEPNGAQFWRLREAPQVEIFDEHALSGVNRGASGLPIWSVDTEDEVEHNELIYRLALLGNSIGFQSYIGLNERSRGSDAKRLAALSLTGLPRGLGLSRYSRKKVEQIDLILFDSAGFPAYAFEIEKSTAITSGIERFIELLKIKINIQGKLVIVCPSHRKRRLDDVLYESVFAGAPMYMDNKLTYFYFKDVVELYQKCQDTRLSLEIVAVEIRNRLRIPRRST